MNGISPVKHGFVDLTAVRAARPLLIRLIHQSTINETLMYTCRGNCDQRTMHIQWGYPCGMMDDSSRTLFIQKSRGVRTLHYIVTKVRTSELQHALLLLGSLTEEVKQAGG